MTPRYSLQNQTGLTLVELAVAAAIAGLMMAAVYTSMSTAFSAWRRFQRGTAIDAAIALERLSMQFSNAPVFSKTPFEAGETRITFAALVNKAEPGKVAEWTLGKATYEYNVSEQALCVSEQTYAGVSTYSGSRCIVLGVEKVQFEYGRLDPAQKELVWSTQWNPSPEETRQYPWAIRIHLTLKSPFGSQTTTLTKTAIHPS